MKIAYRPQVSSGPCKRNVQATFAADDTSTKICLVMGKNSVGATDGIPSPIDVHVGARIRQRRTSLGMSQEKLGDALNLTFQQIQKYERGANRVGASRLYDLCRVFDVTADFFFEGLPNFDAPQSFTPASQAWAGARAFAEKQEPYEAEDGASRDAAELARLFSKITDPKVRESILDLLRSLAARSPSKG